MLGFEQGEKPERNPWSMEKKSSKTLNTWIPAQDILAGEKSSHSSTNGIPLPFSYINLTINTVTR